MTPTGCLNLPKMDGVEIQEEIFIIGEPTPIPGSNKLRALANVGGMLAIVELSLNFGNQETLPTMGK